jgi:hypothetical protein
MAWDTLANMTPAQLAQIQQAIYAPTGGGEAGTSASAPRQALVDGYNVAPQFDAQGNITGYQLFQNDANANNSPALYNGREATNFDAGGQRTGTATLSGFKNGGFGDYLPFVLAGAGLGAGALSVGGLSGVAGAGAGTAGGLDSAGGVLNSAVMGGGADAGAATGLGAASTAGGIDSANGVLNGAVMNGAGGTAAGTAGTAAGTAAATSGGSTASNILAKIAANPLSLAGPAASLASGIMGANAAKDAAKTQADAVNKATDQQNAALDKIIALNEPFRQGGLQGMNALLTAYGLQPGDNSGWAMKDYTPSDLTTDPSYQWRLNQGQQALERSAAAKGGLESGGFMKDLTNYAQGAASQEYGNAYNRYMQNRTSKVNNLQSLAGVGQTATGADTNSTQNTANNVSNLTTQGGNALASGIVGGANAWSNALSQGLSQYQNGELTNALIQRMNKV